jgi:hypothetical protein
MKSTQWIGLCLVLAFGGCADVPPEEPESVEEEDLHAHWDHPTDVVEKSVSTVGELISARACSTAPSARLNAQIAAEMNCLRPDQFGSFSQTPNIDRGPAASPFLQKPAADALRRAFARVPHRTAQMNSSWRSVVQQYVLKSWEGSCGIRIAATPGRSNHESGLSIDIQFDSQLRSALRAEGWQWHCDRTNGGRISGCGDPVHYTYVGRGARDLRRESVKAFQQLWSHNNPNDRITVDGIYGRQTAARIRKSPLSGFENGASCSRPEPQQPVPNEPEPNEPEPNEPEPNEPEPNEPEPEPGESRAVEAFRADILGEDPGRHVDVWHPTGNVSACGSWTIDEDFSSGRFNAHRYQLEIEGQGAVTLSFTRTSGSLTPAVFVFDRRGEPIFVGDAAAGHPEVEAILLSSGRAGDPAKLVLEGAGSRRIFAFVTTWEAIDSGLLSRVSTSARYRFDARQACAEPEPRPPGEDYAGLTMDTMNIPRSGLNNRTMDNVRNHPLTETHGTITSHDGQRFVRGKVSHFGGPNDTSLGSTETGAITGERLRSLNTPLNPSGNDLRSRPEDFYYVAMRFDYTQRGKSAWRDVKLLVVNPANGKRVVVRPVDWGPNIRTGRILDVSPQAISDLGATTDDDLLVSFAHGDTPLGIQ